MLCKFNYQVRNFTPMKNVKVKNFIGELSCMNLFINLFIYQFIDLIRNFP